MAKEYVAGVAYASGTAQVAVLELRAGGISVAHLHEFSGGAGGGDGWFLEPLLEHEHKLYRKVSKVSVAFDESALVLLTFPVDASLDHVERNRHIHWELGNFVEGFSPKDYIIDAHVLRTRAQEQYAELLVVSARRPLVFGVQQQLAGRRFELATADTRLFGGLYALLVNYPELKETQSALVLMSAGRVDVGSVAHGRLTGYAQLVADADEEKAAFVRSTLQAWGAARSFVFGGITHASMTDLLAALGAGAEPLNPLRRLPVRSSFDDLDLFRGQEYRFAPSIGVALRKE